MPDPRGKYVAPAIDLFRFNCPQCGAFAAQTWHMVGATQILEEKSPSGLKAPRPMHSTPTIVREPFLWPETPGKDGALARERNELAKALASGRIFRGTSSDRPPDFRAENLFLSICASCNEPAIWLYDRLLWPSRGNVPPPNPDISADVRRDYEEAGSILDLSPRGAAALLRLAIQKLCAELGAKGSKIDAQIADLVARGLPPRVQKALDVVRVIGNEAVHPGVLDLRDNRDTAASLFGLVNLIAEVMISQPKHVDALYDALPQTKLDAIERRDGKKP